MQLVALQQMKQHHRQRAHNSITHEVRANSFDAFVTQLRCVTTAGTDDALVCQLTCMAKSIRQVCSHSSIRTSRRPPAAGGAGRQSC